MDHLLSYKNYKDSGTKIKKNLHSINIKQQQINHESITVKLKKQCIFKILIQPKKPTSAVKSWSFINLLLLYIFTVKILLISVPDPLLFPYKYFCNNL